MGAFRMTDMDLIVWRHADAGDAAADLARDAERRLTERGRKQAERIARWLQGRPPERHTVPSTPAARAREAAEGPGVKVRGHPRLDPGAGGPHARAALDWPDGPESRSRYVVVVGHQPTLGRLVSLLMSGQEADWSIRKGAVWWLSTREREGREQVVLRAAIAPDLA